MESKLYLICNFMIFFIFANIVFAIPFTIIQPADFPDADSLIPEYAVEPETVVFGPGMDIEATIAPLKFWGQALSPEQAVERASQWMQGHPIMGDHSGNIRSATVWPDMEADYFLYIIKLSPRGYIVLNSAETLPLVVAFSSSSPVSLVERDDNIFLAMLRQTVDRTVDYLNKQQEPGEAEAMDTDKVYPHHTSDLVEQYGPWLETSWNQCHPYNLLCPEVEGGNEYYGFRAPTGCVPTAFAQVLYYHRWPYYGQGSHYYVDSQGDTTGEHEADFSNIYEWSIMQNGYSAFDDNLEDAVHAVAGLMYDLGVAAEADYEVDGTSSSVEMLGQKIAEHFFYGGTLYHHSQDSLLDALENDLRSGYPAVVSIPGHAVVADGLLQINNEVIYHINYGWGGTNNGWYAAGNVMGHAITSGATSIQPLLMPFPKHESVSGFTDMPVKLKWILPQRREGEVDRLLIQYLAEQDIPWQSDASSLDDAMVINWSVVPEGRTGDCWYAGPNGPASLILTDLWVPTAVTELEFWMKYRLGSAAFTVEVSSDGGESFTEIFRRNDNYPLNWQNYSVSLGAFAGQQIQIRFQLYSGSFFPDYGGVWLDDLSLTCGQWLAWEFFAEDTELAAYRFSSDIELWDDATDFGQFEVTSNSDYKDWIIADNGKGGSCFYKEAGGFGNREYHLTTRDTIRPDRNTRLLLRVKRHMANDQLRVLISTNRVDFIELETMEGSSDWADEAVALDDYAGQDIYVRLEYAVDNFFLDGGVWIDSISLQQVQHPEREKQPLHYTYLADLPAGNHILTASLVDRGEVVHRQSPMFYLDIEPGGEAYQVIFEPGEHGFRVGGGALQQTVTHGGSAISPEIEAYEGWTFSGWDVDFDKVTENLQVNGLYEINLYNVYFLAGDHGVLENEEDELFFLVEHGSPLPDEPVVIPYEGWQFTGWNMSLPDTVTTDLTAIAQYIRLSYALIYNAGANGDVEGILTQTVEHGDDGVEVIAIPDIGYRFIQWSDGVETASRTDTNVTADLDVTALFSDTTPHGIPVIWMEEHNLPTDGSIDHEKIGASPFTVYEEWIAGTNPNDVTDILRMTEPPEETTDGFIIRWRSVADRTYTIERSQDLTGDPRFETVAAGIQGIDGVSEYLDETAGEPGSFFYRVVVERE